MPLRLVRRREPAAIHHGLIDAFDVGEPALECCSVRIEQRHRDAGIGKTDGDAAAHGACANDAGRLDRRRTNLVAQPRHATAVAFGEEHVTAPRDSTLVLHSFTSEVSNSRPSAKLDRGALAHGLHGHQARVAVGIELSRLFA